MMWKAWVECAVIGVSFAVLLALVPGEHVTALRLALVIGLCTVCAAHGVARAVLRGAFVVQAVLWVAVLFTPVVPRLVAVLTLREVPVQADAIVVLAAGVHCGPGVLGSSSLDRLLRGVALWRAGFAPVLTVSNPSFAFGPASCPRVGDVERAWLREMFGEAGPRVLTLAEVTTTQDEAARAAALARARGWRTVLLVTSPSHSARAALLFRAAMRRAGLGTRVVSVPSAESAFDVEGRTVHDRVLGLRVVLYEALSRVKARVSGG
ncbi:YdcF family protein [Deinococcus maricopensis]|uniref:YdcF family protein n=1 Tax=Deinococcus maricopensis TaxID=309887 RepID=UPI0002EE2BDA|nr:YdcF family protein [Deinococcus maricopensis]